MHTYLSDENFSMIKFWSIYNMINISVVQCPRRCQTWVDSYLLTWRKAFMTTPRHWRSARYLALFVFKSLSTQSETSRIRSEIRCENTRREQRTDSVRHTIIIPSHSAIVTRWVSKSNKDFVVMESNTRGKSMYCSTKQYLHLISPVLPTKLTGPLFDGKITKGGNGHQ